MLTHLVESGAKSVAVISTAPVYSYILDLHRAYERWCESRSQTPLVVHVAAPTEDAGFHAATELLSSHSPPDAIYTSFDRLGIGVLRAAQARHVAVPGELRVASHSDSDPARTNTPSLTTLNLHPDEIGKTGIDMLIALVNGEETTSRHSLIETTVVKRESTTSRTVSQESSAHS